MGLVLRGLAHRGVRGISGGVAGLLLSAVLIPAIFVRGTHLNRGAWPFVIGGLAVGALIFLLSLAAGAWQARSQTSKDDPQPNPPNRLTPTERARSVERFAGRAVEHAVDGMLEASDARASVELASEEHRADVRAWLRNGAQVVELNREWLDDRGTVRRVVEAHYPDLIERVDAWNAVVKRWYEARHALRDRLRWELSELSLDARYEVSVLVGGLVNLIAARASSERLGAPFSAEIWSYYPPTSREEGSVHFTGSPAEVAIHVGDVAPDAFDNTARELTAVLNPLWDAARTWPETFELSEATAGFSAFDRQAIYERINDANEPDRIYVAKDCPRCWRIG